jgi:hypothetical protein
VLLLFRFLVVSSLVPGGQMPSCGTLGRLPVQARLKSSGIERGVEHTQLQPVRGRPVRAVPRPAVRPVFGLLLVGYFDEIDSERRIGWRATDSFAVRSFVRLGSTSRPRSVDDFAARRLIDMETETHRGVHVDTAATPRGRALEPLPCSRGDRSFWSRLSRIRFCRLRTTHDETRKAIARSVRTAMSTCEP